MLSVFNSSRSPSSFAGLVWVVSGPLINPILFLPLDVARVREPLAFYLTYRAEIDFGIQAERELEPGLA
jgi:hypothetical protein